MLAHESHGTHYPSRLLKKVSSLLFQTGGKICLLWWSVFPSTLFVRTGVSPDPAITSMLESFKAMLGPILSRVVTTSPFAQARDGNCKFSSSELRRTCETVMGNTIADAIRSDTGSDFAFVNTGGIRDGFTCTEPGGEGFCPNNQTSSGPFYVTVGTIRNVSFPLILSFVFECLFFR